jgi:hypothetical protein
MFTTETAEAAETKEAADEEDIFCFEGMFCLVELLVELLVVDWFLLRLFDFLYWLFLYYFLIQLINFYNISCRLEQIYYYFYLFITKLIYIYQYVLYY